MEDEIDTSIGVRARDMIQMYNAAVERGDNILAEEIARRFPGLFTETALHIRS